MNTQSFLAGVASRVPLPSDGDADLLGLAGFNSSGSRLDEEPDGPAIEGLYVRELDLFDTLD